MITRSGLTVKLAKGANGHLLTWGQSGQGKTFFLCRKAEEYVNKGKKILIFDYSGSFSEKELAEKNFKFPEQIHRYSVDEPRKLTWRMRVKKRQEFKKDVVDALLEVLDCGSYFQQDILESAIDRILDKQDGFNIPDIVKELKIMLEEGAEENIAGSKDNIGRLLTRLRPYKSVVNLSIKQGITDKKEIAPISIVDLSNLPEKQRKFLTKLLLSLLWRESFRQEVENRCDVIFLDEFQFLSVEEGSTLSYFLREGRKRGWEMVLSTQFIKNYSSGEKQVLQQAANIVIFRPTPEDCRFSAKIIDINKYKSWETALMSLGRGEAVLRGNYYLEKSEEVATTPIIVRI